MHFFEASQTFLVNRIRIQWKTGNSRESNKSKSFSPFRKNSNNRFEYMPQLRNRIRKNKIV